MNFFKSIIILLLLSTTFYAQDLRIGLFYNEKPKEVLVSYNIGRYKLFSETQIFEILNQNDKIQVKAKGEKVQVILNNNILGEFTWFRMEKKASLNSILLQAKGIKRKFRGDMIFYAIKGELKIINEVDVEQYIPGVIKGEAGYGRNSEYYKVQAVISRTYAFKYQKHEKEGYDLCDHTHCQVYKGINYSDSINKAVERTKSEVIVDDNLELIDALFSANCGGLTANSEDVWDKKTSYLRSVKDTFCVRTSIAKWSEIIPKDRWNVFLKEQKLGISSDYNFSQTQRTKYLFVGNGKISTTRIRHYFRFRSAYFNIIDKGNNLIFEGNGFGHGVGLCQEGAINMTSQNFNYKDVIKKYYTSVHIINASQIGFYQLF